ncbi:hypothetical protein KI387_015679 [Taxus chinensis]|uniref:Protein kinase domain-containing protein n=1 Tax=Taxus chinensis TaxID=29808 RepID=A0AA38GFG8_TAXCH|nr:hypothetical protein KI387_015679 [Taxus chinensis]
MWETPGYLAPKWLLNTGISSKSDVYSFGMVLFEFISGQKNMDASVEDEEKRHHPSWAWRVVEDQKRNREEARDLVDPILQGEYNLKEVEVLLSITFMCIQADASTRPTMGQVVKIFAKKTLESHDVIDLIFGSHMQEKGFEGYTTPEYATHGQLTDKADVYSYGMLVLEIPSGRKVRDPKLPLEMELLLQWAWSLHEKNEAFELVDKRIAKGESEIDREEIVRVIHIAHLCTQSALEMRPSMSNVV